MQEQQVDVARVVQLVPAELAERDHGELPVSGAMASPSLMQASAIALISTTTSSSVAPVRSRAATRRIARRRNRRRPSTGPETIDVGRELGAKGTTTACRDVGERMHLVRVRHEEVGRGPREAEQTGRALGDLRPSQRFTGRRIVADPREGHAGELGIGCRCERAAEHLGGQHPGIIAGDRMGTAFASRWLRFAGGADGVEHLRILGRGEVSGVVAGERRAHGLPDDLRAPCLG